MFSVQDFTSKYKTIPDEELYGIYAKPDNYSGEALEAAMIVIDHRDGKVIENRLREKQAVCIEINRLRKEVAQLYAPTIKEDFLAKMITSDILSAAETAQVVRSKFTELTAAQNDTAIKPRTIYGSLSGAAMPPL